MREAYRLQKQEIQGQEKKTFTLLFIYIGKDVAVLKQLKQLSGCFKKIALLYTLYLP